MYCSNVLPVSPSFSGHVGISARHSNHFRVSVNTEAHTSVTFYLLYEELLQRRAGIYEHVINLTPRQKLKDFAIEVRESHTLTTQEAPLNFALSPTGSHPGESEPHPPPRAGTQATRGLRGRRGRVEDLREEGAPRRKSRRRTRGGESARCGEIPAQVVGASKATEESARAAVCRRVRRRPEGRGWRSSGRHETVTQMAGHKHFRLVHGRG